MIQMNCQGLTLGYDSVLVRDLSFTIHAGDYLYILGENGTGKSTLMRTILGLLPPLEGSVVLGGGVLPAEIGYLPQQTQAQRDFPATVWEVALSGCQGRCGLRPFYTRAEKDLARHPLPPTGAVIGSCREASSSGCCWPGLFARPKKCCCWTSRYPAWIRPPAGSCIR